MLCIVLFTIFIVYIPMGGIPYDYVIPLWVYLKYAHMK